MIDDEVYRQLFSYLNNNDCESKWIETIDLYLREGGEISITFSLNGWGFLHYAAENQFFRLSEYLISHGVDVDLQALDETTPYLVALDSAIDSAVQNGDEVPDFSVVKLLVKNGANVDASSNEGISKDSILNSYGTEIKRAYFDAMD